MDDAPSEGASWSLPPRYGKLLASMVLDVCERFGQDPFGPWWDGLPAGAQELLLAHERIKQAEGAGRE